MLNNILLNRLFNPADAGYGLSFDKTNDYIQLPTTFLNVLQNYIQYNKDFTIAFWIYINSSFATANGQGNILQCTNNANYNGSDTKGLNIGSYSSNTLFVSVNNVGVGNNSIRVLFVKNLPVGLHHICMTHKAGIESKIFIDGVYENTNPTTLTNLVDYADGSISPRIGYYPFASINYFQGGSIFDFKIYNKIMPATAQNNLVFNMPFESLYKTGANVFTPELVSGNDGQLIGYPAGAKGIVDRFGNDIQLVP